MINSHDSGSNAVQGFYLDFAYGKINIPAIPGSLGDVVANDWCIS